MSIITVGDLTRYIKSIFDNDRTMSAVFVRGEISNFKQHYSGHCYFTLKDNESTIKAVMFKSRSQYLKFIPTNGLKVIAAGRVTVFERDGQYQLYVEQLMPEGVGELSMAYAQLKDKLEKEGLFDAARKRCLPLLPKAVGIITSPTGAAIRDIVTVAKRRNAGIPLYLYPVQVQGVEAPGQIVNALRVLNSLDKVDVIILGRGGGSIEELWAFNDEAVARAIAISSIPVVSAVGHQTDFTLADFVADIRAATPSQAAELVIPDSKELSRYIKSLQNSMESAIANLLSKQRTRVEHCLLSTSLSCPRELFADKNQILDQYFQRLLQGMDRMITHKQHDFKILAEKLAVLNPLSALARGYSVVQTKDKRIVNKYRDTKINEELEVVLQEGQLDVKVIGIREDKRGKR